MAKEDVLEKLVIDLTTLVKVQSEAIERIEKQATATFSAVNGVSQRFDAFMKPDGQFLKFREDIIAEVRLVGVTVDAIHTGLKSPKYFEPVPEFMHTLIHRLGEEVRSSVRAVGSEMGTQFGNTAGAQIDQQLKNIKLPGGSGLTPWLSALSALGTLGLCYMWIQAAKNYVPPEFNVKVPMADAGVNRMPAPSRN